LHGFDRRKKKTNRGENLSPVKLEEKIVDELSF
jgi:hypothetical protein